MTSRHRVFPGDEHHRLARAHPGRRQPRHPAGQPADELRVADLPLVVDERHRVRATGGRHLHAVSQDSVVPQACGPVVRGPLHVPLRLHGGADRVIFLS